MAARHSFAHYLGDKAVGYRLVALHFNELDCTNRAALCTSRGCLHQVYMSTDGVYRLVFSANVSDITLRFLDHTPAIEIDCERFGPQDCPRVLRWNGRRFAGQPYDQLSRAQLKAIEATRLVTDTRRAYFDVVVATNLASVRERSKLSANARAELAKKIGGIGALNKPDQTRGRTSYADDVPLAQVFLAQRERLTVLAGRTISSAKAPTAVASARELSDQ